MDMPVSCMEAGRWNRQREDFAAGEAVFRAKSRAVQKAGVTTSLRRKGRYRSNQGAVWDEVSDSLAEMHAPSAPSDFRAGRARVAHRIDAFAEAVRPQARQIGAMFLSKRGVLGVELLATPELFSCCFRKMAKFGVGEKAFIYIADSALVTPKNLKDRYEGSNLTGDFQALRRDEL